MAKSKITHQPEPNQKAGGNPEHFANLYGWIECHSFPIEQLVRRATRCIYTGTQNYAVNDILNHECYFKDKTGRPTAIASFPYRGASAYEADTKMVADNYLQLHRPCYHNWYSDSPPSRFYLLTPIASKPISAVQWCNYQSCVSAITHGFYYMRLGKVKISDYNLVCDHLGRVSVDLSMFGDREWANRMSN